MVRRTRCTEGFTLVEVAIVVVILGVLTSIAIPAFVEQLRRARTSEATGNLNSLFRSASALYAQERAEKGIDADVASNCVVGDTALTPAKPSLQKQRFDSVGGFRLLNFSIADYVYYGYQISSVAGAAAMKCPGASAGQAGVYTFVARGDLDGDGTQSLFELAVGAGANNQLYHGRGFHIEEETE
jgi:prepilin-type N-terminal cleavage/methylation domain-containing protein